MHKREKERVRAERLHHSQNLVIAISSSVGWSDGHSLDPSDIKGQPKEMKKKIPRTQTPLVLCSGSGGNTQQGVSHWMMESCGSGTPGWWNVVDPEFLTARKLTQLPLAPAPCLFLYLVQHQQPELEVLAPGSWVGALPRGLSHQHPSVSSSITSSP